MFALSTVVEGGSKTWFESFHHEEKIDRFTWQNMAMSQECVGDNMKSN